jgi:uncharacterized protein (DUF1697 family)
MSKVARPSRRSAADGRQIALLRGINVGRAKRVAMADLRAIVESLDCRDVRTLLNSGNVVFTSAGVAAMDMAGRIEKALTARLGVSSVVTVLTAAELDAVVADNSLLNVAHDPSRLLVVIPRTVADCRRLVPLRKQQWAPERLVIGKRAAYLWCPDGVIVSPLFQAVGRLLGDAMTSRNWSTVVKLQELAESL